MGPWNVSNKTLYTSCFPPDVGKYTRYDKILKISGFRQLFIAIRYQILPKLTMIMIFSLFSYMYYDKTVLSGETVLGVLYAAKKYRIPSLETECRKFLENKLDPSNVCVVLQQVIKLWWITAKAGLVGSVSLTTKCPLHSGHTLVASKWLRPCKALFYLATHCF